MKETPIIMSGNHAKLILDGIKTMTRRVIKPQPLDSYLPDSYIISELKKIPQKTIKIHDKDDPTFYHVIPRCPYDQVGDRLWVRETFWTESGDIYYKTDWLNDKPVNMVCENGKWKSSRFMPRWASRITLEITEVRVERLQEITEEDAKAEGVICCPNAVPDYRHHFMVLWDSLNAKRGYGWEVNPFVWVISFKVLRSQTKKVSP